MVKIDIYCSTFASANEMLNNKKSTVLITYGHSDRLKLCTSALHEGVYWLPVVTWGPMFVTWGPMFVTWRSIFVMWGPMFVMWSPMF